MTYWMRCKATALAGITLAGTTLALPASADVTPQEVWSDFSAYVQSFGYEVTGTESMSGDTLTISGVAMSVALPEDEGTVAINMAEVILRQIDDGAVAIDFPATMPITVNMAPEFGEKVDIIMDLTHDGLQMQVSGTPEALDYSYSAARMGIGLSDMVVDGETIGRDVAAFSFDMNGLSGASQVAIGELRDISQQLVVASITYDLLFNDPDSDDRALINGMLDNLSFDGDTRLPLEMNTADMGQMLAQGLSLAGSFGYENSNAEFFVIDEGATTRGQSGSDTASLEFRMDGTSLTYSGSGTGTAIALSGGDIPVPIEIGMAETAFNLTMPVSASDETADVAFGLTLGEFTMSDLLWSLADPGKVLPRDPATVAFDLTGKVKLLVDFFDPEAMARVETGDVVPAELNALTLRSLLVQAAGAKLTGTGDVTFDNSDMQTFDGFPRPTGSVNLQLVGANGLIDGLIQMGLLAEEDAMGARMMMSMFTVPAGAEDTLNSTLEVNEAGHVLANGQRIR